MMGRFAVMVDLMMPWIAGMMLTATAALVVFYVVLLMQRKRGEKRTEES